MDASDSAAQQRYASAHALLRSSREDWSSYLVDTTDSVLSWAVFEGRHGVIDVSLPTQLSLTLRSGRQKDTYFGPVDPKLSRTGAQYRDRVRQKIDALLLHVWDSCVRACPSSSSSSSSSGPRSLLGPDVVLIGHGPGCEAVLRLIAARALHMSQSLAKVQAGLAVPTISRPLPIVRAVVQVYGYEDLALVPKVVQQHTAGPGPGPGAAPAAAIGASPRGMPPTPSTAALAAASVMGSEATTAAVATVAQYASQPGGVGLTIAAQRLGLPTSANGVTLAEHGPHINPGALPTTPGRNAAGRAEGEGPERSGEERERADLLAGVRAGPELRKWYAANSKVILPKDHPYFRWKLENKVKRAAGDISKRPNESDPLKLLAHTLPGIVSFIEGRVTPESGGDDDDDALGAVLAEDSHASAFLVGNMSNIDGAAQPPMRPLLNVAAASPLASSSGSESGPGLEYEAAALSGMLHPSGLLQR